MVRVGKRFLLFAATGLIVVTILASLIVWYENEVLAPTLPHVFWRAEIEHLATALVVADEKVFVTDDWSGVFCFDVESGESIWNSSMGSVDQWRPKNLISVYEGKVYVSDEGGAVNRLNGNTGEFEMVYHAPTPPDLGRAQPEVYVADGKVFASFQGSIATYNADNGELLWWKGYFNGEYSYGNKSVSTPKSDLVFIDNTGYPISRLDPDTGDWLWRVNGVSGEPALVSQERVILWNFSPDLTASPQNRTTILCVDATYGEDLWNFDVGKSIYQPVISNGLILFGAQDGYFYALNLTDGALEWKTFVTNPTIGKYSRASLPVFDEQNRRVFWTVNINANSGVAAAYEATIVSLGIETGSAVWIKRVTNNNPALVYLAITSMALFNEALYVSEYADLYAIDANSGNLRWKQNYDHSVLQLLVTHDKLFVLADGTLTAYG